MKVTKRKIWKVEWFQLLAFSHYTESRLIIANTAGEAESIFKESYPEINKPLTYIELGKAMEQSK